MDVDHIVLVTSTLTEAVSKVCPIDGVSIGDVNDKTTWVIQYSDATDEQKAAADAIVNSFDTNIKARRLVAKSDIINRLHDAGLLDKAITMLNAQDNYTQQRWLVRNAIYNDDPTAVTLLRSIGANPDEILA